MERSRGRLDCDVQRPGGLDYGWHRGRAEEGALGDGGSAARAKTCLVLEGRFHSRVGRGGHPEADGCATRWRALGRRRSAMLAAVRRVLQ